MIVYFWGRNGRFPFKDPRERVGGEAPHPFPCDLWVGDGRVDDFQGRLLKIIVLGPLGAWLAYAVSRG